MGLSLSGWKSKAQARWKTSTKVDCQPTSPPTPTWVDGSCLDIFRRSIPSRAGPESFFALGESSLQPPPFVLSLSLSTWNWYVCFKLNFRSSDDMYFYFASIFNGARRGGGKRKRRFFFRVRWLSKAQENATKRWKGSQRGKDFEVWQGSWKPETTKDGQFQIGARKWIWKKYILEVTTENFKFL